VASGLSMSINTLLEVLTACDEDFTAYGYEQIKYIGHGQFASAYLVRRLEDSQQFVAKVIVLDHLNDRNQRLAQQEVEVLKILRHQNVVGYNESFFIGSAAGSRALVIIMEYCDCGDLHEFIRDRVRDGKPEHLDERQIMQWFVQVLVALQHIHSQNVLHRDLKSSNLFLTDSCRTLKIGDFGISRVLEGTQDAAVTVVGTPYYMSPEVCRSEPYRDKSDVWALGCCLYEMCMLKHAFESNSLLGLVYRIVSDHYDPIPEMYSPELNDLICWLLAKSADARPSAREVMAHPYVRSFTTAPLCPSLPKTVIRHGHASQRTYMTESLGISP